MEVVTFKFYLAKIFINAGTITILFLQDFRIFSLIILWVKCVPPMRLWQTQLNFAVFCASSACGVSSAHLNYTKHPMIRSVYRFHVYYHVKRIFKKLQVPLLHETGFNAADNPYTESEFLKIL